MFKPNIILGMFGPWEIVIIVLVIVLIFGGRKIPELMKGLGQGMKEFKKATKEDDDQKDSEK
ncbi:MAG: twin-arginine translocase TatA/TatE family subunit [Marinilabiliales bacterium]|nr:MAG: twin-arginine translocase TatA/TatE family subunit [Marinilabiliales bacterium]